MRLRSFPRTLALAWLTFAYSVPGNAADGGDAIVPLSAFPRETIYVETRAARRHAFDAWRAETPALREQGLMFVSEIRADQAMIFVYRPPEYVAMWMKNTLIPLDMLFVDDKGCIVKVHERARPQTLDAIATDGRVALVVELKGGTAAALGIHAGDRVARPSVDWPVPGGTCTSTH